MNIVQRIRMSLTALSDLQLSRDTKTWIVTLGCLGPIIWLLLHGYLNLLAFLIVLTSLVILTIASKELAICATLTYLFLLGDIRRMVGMFLGFPKLDLLLLVGPVITILLALPILIRLRLKDRLTKVTLALMVVMMLEIVNPRQGSIVVGLSGAMFYLVPVLWFWIGRRYGTDTLLFTIIYRVIIPLAVLGAIVGLAQMYVGFLPWESAWIAEVGSHYHALSLGNGLIRAFGYSVNSVEYTCLLMVACTCSLAAFFAGRRAYGFLVPLLGVALFLESSRTAIVKLIFSVSVAWALSSKGGKGWGFRLPIAIAVLTGILAVGLSSASSGAADGSSAASVSTQHQVEGLSHPLDSKKSTAGLHAAYFLGGFKQAFSYPIGYGLGSVTLGAGKFGGDSTEDSPGGTEVDISDAFVSLGVVGGFLYLYTVVLVLRRALVFGSVVPKYLGLPALALLASMGGAWIPLGQYAMGPVIWFVIGVLARNFEENPTQLRDVKAIRHAYPARPREIQPTRQPVQS